MKIHLLTLFLVSCISSYAQELSCRVIINSQQIQTTNRSIFDQMEKTFEDFINDRVWTDDQYKNQEKIKCVIQITLESSPEIGSYSGAVQIVAARPVYNTTYESKLINFADRNFDFQYTESQPLNYTDGSFTDNLTSLLAYYAYMILGYDYDTFSRMGGTRYFDRAQQIVNSAQGQAGAGWEQFSSTRNRYWWVNDMQNQVMSNYREAVYEYHRKGLDLMQSDLDNARASMLGALKKIQTSNKSKPRSILVISFLDAKKDELINVFSKGDMGVRREAFDILKELDPARTDEYRAIMSN